MISSIRSITVNTLKWGISLGTPLVITNFALRRFKALQDHLRAPPFLFCALTVGAPSALLLRKLAGCSWTTSIAVSALYSSILWNTVRARRSKGGSGVDRLKSENLRLEAQKSNNLSKTPATEKGLELADSGMLRNPARKYNDLFSARYTELGQDQKTEVWQAVLEEILQLRFSDDNSLILPFHGDKGEVLVLKRKDQRTNVCTLEGRVGNKCMWSIRLDTDEKNSERSKSDRYIQLLIEGLDEIKELSNVDQYYSKLFKRFHEIIPNLLDLPPETALEFFNNVIAPHDVYLRLSFATSRESDRVFPLMFTRVILTRLTLFVRHDTISDDSVIYKIGLIGSLGERIYDLHVKSTGRNGKSCHITYEGKKLQLSGYPQRGFHFGDNSTPREVKKDIWQIIEIVQAVVANLRSAHTIVNYKSKPYDLLGNPISRERLEQIAAFTNDANGGSYLNRQDNGEFFWGLFPIKAE